MIFDILQSSYSSILLIIIIVFLVVENNKQSKMVFELRKELKKLKKGTNDNSHQSDYAAAPVAQNNYAATSSAQNNNVPSQTVATSSSTIPNQAPNPSVTQKAPTKSSVEEKNNAILVTGAIFIILAAIVFLRSTWSILNPTIKSVVMFLLVGVFLGASSLAKKKFHLEQTSKAFFYIAMAYIPICFTSLWVFGIISDLWQVDTVNKYAYFAFSFIITACIYYLYYSKNKSKILYVGSIAFGLLALISFVLIFENNTGLLCLAVCLYSLIITILMRLLKKQDIPFNKNIVITLFVIGIVYTGALALNAIFLAPIIEVITKTQYDQTLSIYVLASMIISGINSCILYFKYDKQPVFWVLQAITFYIATVFFTFKVLNNVSDSVLIFTGISLAMALAIIYMFIGKLLNQNGFERIANRTLINCCIPLYYMVALSKVLFESINVYIPSLIALIELIILLVCYFMTNKKSVYKYLIYLCSIILTYSFVNCFDFNYKDEVFSIIPLCFALGIYVLESLVKRLKDNGSDALFICLNVISFIALLPSRTVAVTVIGLVYAVLLFILNIVNKENDYLRIIPMLGALLLLLGHQDYSDRFYFIGRMVMTIICTGYPLITKRKLTAETFFGGISLVMMASFFDNHSIRLLTYLAWELVNMVFVKQHTHKDYMKALIYATAFALYVDLMNKTSLKDYSSTFKIPFIIMVILYLKTIIYKYVKDIHDRDLLDYLLLGVSYFIALFSYSTVYDGMIFSLFLVFLIIYSYLRKHGAIFVATTIGVIVNVFLLTRKFWLSIPWWGYLLFIGVLLIGFAIRNESKENKEKISIGNKIKELKDNIDGTPDDNTPEL